MKVLITSGGGAKGAFSVGALQHLLGPGGIDFFDLVSGTSTGSLIAAMVTAGKMDTLTNVYLNTQNTDILKPANIVTSLTEGKPYVYDTEPLLKQVETHVDDDAYVTIMNGPTTLCLNSVCLDTGRLTVFSNREILPDRHYDRIIMDNRDLMIRGLLGSSNQAVFMKPVEINGRSYVDGGNKEVVPSRAVVSNLDNDPEHEIYVLSNNPNELVASSTGFGDILKVLMRAISIFIQEVRENDLEVLITSKKISPSKIRIFYICPDEELDEDYPTGLRFSKVKMMGWMRLGKTKARQVLTDYPEGNLG